MDDEGAEREFWVALFNLPQVDSLRSLRSAQLGRLVAFQVRPADFKDESASLDDTMEVPASSLSGVSVRPHCYLQAKTSTLSTSVERRMQKREAACRGL